MGRSLNDFITGYLEFTKNTESSTSYHLWSCISLIASALERKCYIEWGHTVIYPNQYIIIVGPSGEARKGEPLVIARSFLEHLGSTTASQSSSRESLIKTITNSGRSFMSDAGEFVIQCPMTIVAPELAVLVGQKDTKFLADLTDWYDSHDSWTYQTLARGPETIIGVCVNLLAATAPDWLPSILPQEAVGGGFTSRIIFVVEEQKGQIVADPRIHRPDAHLEKQLKDDLEQIHLMQGEFDFSDRALTAYTDWYTKQEQGIKDGRWPVTDPKFRGYVSRRATHIKKIGMCVSASRGDDLIIHLEDFERARIMLETVEKKMSRAFTGLGRVPFADLTEAVLKYIKQRGKCKRSQLLGQFYRDIDGWTLEKIEQVLSYMKVVRITYLTGENDALYEFTGAPDEGSDS